MCRTGRLQNWKQAGKIVEEQRHLISPLTENVIINYFNNQLMNEVIIKEKIPKFAGFRFSNVRI